MIIRTRVIFYNDEDWSLGEMISHKIDVLFRSVNELIRATSSPETNALAILETAGDAVHINIVWGDLHRELKLTPLVDHMVKYSTWGKISIEAFSDLEDWPLPIRPQTDWS